MIQPVGRPKRPPGVQKSKTMGLSRGKAAFSPLSARSKAGLPNLAAALKTAQKTALKRTQQNGLERKLGLQNQGSQNTNQNEAHNQSRLIIQNPELSLDLLEIDLSVSPNENDLRNQNLSKNQNSTTQKRTTTNLSSQPTTKTTRKYDLTN